MTENIKRELCAFTGAKDLEPVASFKHFPIYMGCTAQPFEKDIFADMDWYISRSTGSIQLNPLLPLELLYAEQHNEAVGSLWQMHHREFSKFISGFKPKSVFEIGAAHGLLAKDYLKRHPKTQWNILEPNPTIGPDVPVKLMQGFFDEVFVRENNRATEFDALVHSHVFEHIYKPQEFMRAIGDFVPEGKLLLFSLPNMMQQLKSFFTNCLNFEHTIFLIEPYLDCLLAQRGFRIIEKTYFQDHSIFYAARKETSRPRPPQYPNLYEQNKGLMTAYVRHHTDAVKDLNSKVEASPYPTYLFGAHVFSQSLINFGLNAEKIVSVLDNGPNKIGKRLYGTQLQVESPKVLKDKGKVNVILKAGAYNAEIKADILKNINSQVVFWE